MTRKERYEKVLEYFRRQMPEVNTELEFGSIFQLLVAVVLSAQCTDKRVNMVTPGLFKRYPGPQDMAGAEPEEVREYISSVSYPTNKAKHLVGMARAIMEKHGGEVPSDMDSLLALPGVGRKTANVIQSVVFNKAAMAVDTHVFRVSNRLGLAHANTPLRTEEQLKQAIPQADWSKAHHWLIWHGRKVCHAQNPACSACPLSDCCDYFQDKNKR